MKFEDAGTQKYKQRYCEAQTTHKGRAKSGQWIGTWLGWPMGSFCHDCKKEWERMYEEFRS